MRTARGMSGRFGVSGGGEATSAEAREGRNGASFAGRQVLLRPYCGSHPVASPVVKSWQLATVPR